MSDDLTPSELRWRRCSKLGMSDPMAMARIAAGWDELAGTPWSGRSRPLFIQGKTLVVEAGAPSMVAFLRYGSPTGRRHLPSPRRGRDREDRGSRTGRSMIDVPLD